MASKEGQSQYFICETGPEGIKLTPIKTPEPRRIQGKLVRRNGKLFFEVPRGLELAPGPIPREVLQ